MKRILLFTILLSLGFICIGCFTPTSKIPPPLRGQFEKEWVGKTVWLRRPISKGLIEHTKVVITGISYAQGMVFHFRLEDGTEGDANVWPYKEYDKEGVRIALERAFCLDTPKLCGFTLIEPVQNTLNYRNRFVSIAFELFVASDERSLRDDLDCISFSIRNEIGTPIEIIWDRCRYIDPLGFSHRVVHSGVRLVEKDKPQTPTIIPPKEAITTTIVPSDRIFYSKQNGWDTESLFCDFEKVDLNDLEFCIVFAIKLQEEIRDYPFKFKVIAYDRPTKEGP